MKHSADRAPRDFDLSDVRAATVAAAREAASVATDALEPGDRSSPRTRIDPSFLAMLEAACIQAVDGGKQVRARLMLTSWSTLGKAQPPVDYAGAVQLAAALEMFQASALVHDDIVDGADTRRGRPAVHRSLETEVAARFGPGRAKTLGADLAILVGDLLLIASTTLACQAARAIDSVTANPILATLNQMRAEVMVGQFLDTLAPATPLRAFTASLEEAIAIAQVKSARYSVVFPLLIGALAAGAAPSAAEGIGRFGTHLGLAFQLRDDLLSVFGDRAATGKPTGTDLMEGKRTCLLAIARFRLPDRDRQQLESLVTAPAGPLGADVARALIAQSGAADVVEELIDSSRREALAALDALPLRARTAFEAIAVDLIDRTA
ncbi:MAG: polyprenyl synthetase family protein [Bifidobacteriaceae bacterium]|nr:polyprenyl synthetase family protein [Bifidobacteriaceae bacterium]